jgi:hypothetical protein
VNLKTFVLEGIIMGYHSAICPECGREIQAPEGLQSVICNYCGAKFDPAGETNGGGIDEDFSSCYDKAVSMLDKNLTLIQDLSKVFDKEVYKRAFENYYDRLTASLDYFDRAYNACTGDRGKLVADYADEYGRRILENMGKAQGSSTSVNERYVYHYIVFAIPAVMKYGKPYSDKMSDILLATWNSRFTKRKLGKASFEQINSGFKHKICFITTAVTQTMGLPDDCYALCAFRSFRDGYLAAQPHGRLEIMEYYLTAPAIVAAIDSSPSKEQVYRDIWDKQLSKCLRLYEQMRYKQCRRAYEDMVGELRERWL